MSEDSAPDRKSIDAAAPPAAGADADPVPRKLAPAWVTRFATFACIGIFFGLQSQENPAAWESLSKFGALPPDKIWNRGWWALITSAFVHYALWHMFFNVYWLWTLGSALERAIGSWRYLAFVAVSAFVSSSCQLATSGSSGIGASGVVYAIFGFMWPARRRYAEFARLLDGHTIQTFVVWLVACIAITQAGLLPIGNAAHISGIAFGAAVAGAFVLHWNRLTVLAALSALVLFSITTLFWNPWSAGWLINSAFNANSAGQYDKALARYTQLIALDPNDAWAYSKRSLVYAELGDTEKARADFETALRLNSALKAMGQDKP